MIWAKRDSLLIESNGGPYELSEFLRTVKKGKDNKGENEGKIDYQKLIDTLNDKQKYDQITDALDVKSDGKSIRRKPIDKEKFKKALIMEYFAQELQDLKRLEEKRENQHLPPQHWIDERVTLANKYSERPELNRHTGFFKGLGVLFKNIFKGKLDTRTNSQVHLDSFIQTQRDIKARLQQATQGKSSESADEDKSATPPMKSPYSR